MADGLKIDVHPSAPLAIASGAVVLAGLDVVVGLLAVRDDEAFIAVPISLGLRLFAGLCVVSALIAAFLADNRRGLQATGVLGVAAAAVVVVLVGHSLAQEATTYIP